MKIIANIFPIKNVLLVLLCNFALFFVGDI